MRRHRRDLEILSEMNLTNLLDTAFTLLIAFMFVAPMMKHGIELELPKVSRGPLESATHTVTIVINKRPAEDLSEPIYIDEERVDLDSLEEKMREIQNRYDAFNVAIEADAASTYDTFAKVLARLKNMGIENVGLVTEPEELE